MQIQGGKKYHINKVSIQDLWNIILQSNTQRVPEKQERKNGAEEIFEEVMAKTFT